MNFYSRKFLQRGLFFCAFLSLVLIIFNNEYFSVFRNIWTFTNFFQNNILEIPCVIPKLNPFDSEIMSFMKIPKKYNCLKKYPLLFSSDEFSNLLVLHENIKLNNYSECCYSSFKRGKDADWKRKLSKKCKPINIRNASEIPIEDEFINVKCRKNASEKLKQVDAFGFVPRKPKVESRIAKACKNRTTSSDLNVIILGIDSLSHMNFIRKMGKSYKYLTKDLHAVGMNGYFAVGDNSLPNFSAFLIGLSKDEVDTNCYKETDHFDTCPFVWKNFSEKGFRTFFGEDGPNMATFNYVRRGFSKQPTDYYLQALLYILLQIRSKDMPNMSSCYGPRYVFEILLDYMKKTASAFKTGEKHFQFIWSNSVAHDYINTPTLSDKFLFEFFKWFKKRDYFERTAFFLISDHGQRLGKIRETYQGNIETRMPLFYAVFPKWFQLKYSDAISNFKTNSHRLTTPFDLHETFLDLSDCEENISQESIFRRADHLSKLKTLPRGISLFLPVPKLRSCAQANISKRYCVCQYEKPIPVKNELKAMQAANTVVQVVNNYLTNATSKCAKLVVKTVKKFSILKMVVSDFRNSSNSNSTQEFLVTFVTEPGNGTFETIVSLNYKGVWSTGLMEDINRINLYGNQSYCVQERVLKTFCYCIQNI